MFAQPYEYTKTHKIVYFKKASFMACELHLNKIHTYEDFIVICINAHDSMKGKNSIKLYP